MNYRKAVAIVLTAAITWAGLATGAAAAVVSTQQAFAFEQRQQRVSDVRVSDVRVSDVRAALARTDVRQAMIRLGVDPVQADLRVESLSDRELAVLAGELERLPAGGNILGLIGAVFVVLLILELTGVVDIFKKF